MAESQGNKVNVYEKEADVTPPTSGMDKESCCDVSKENEKSEPATTGDKEPSATDVDELSDLLSKFAMRKVEVGSSGEDVKPKPEQVLEELTLNGVAQYIKSGRCKKIIVMTGAGLSTAAGIPDFRSPGTGLYDNLQKYDLPSPQSVFEISYFKTNPEPFFSLAKELYPGKYKPTIGHYFIRLLADKELLLRNYTQNIDCLERKTGIDAELIVEAHGSFHTAHCLNCGKDYPQEWVKDEVFADRVPRCNSCENGGVVKPDIVFFGESLPSRFATLVTQDMYQCDLLIIMGTSLLVQPFASLVDRVRPITPRLLINKEKCNHQPDFMSLLFGIRSGLQFDSEDNYRDVAWIGTCDDGCVALADLLGWKDELLKLAESNNKLLDKESGTEISGKKAIQLKSNDGKQDKPKGNL